MDLETRWVRFPSSGEMIDALFARPLAAQEALPAVVVVQEIWGVDLHVQDLVARFATAGYAAIAPDLYSRGGRPAELEPGRVEAVKAFLDSIPPTSWSDASARSAALAVRPDDERARLGPTLDRLMAPQRPIARWVGDLRATLEWLCEMPETSECRIGIVGFCLGGALAALLATEEPALSAAAVFYGQMPPPERAADVRCPILGLFGGEDARVLATVPPFAQAMAAVGNRFEQHVYPATPHAFFNDTRRSFRVDAARDAWWRVLRFLAETLAPAP
jgi:carboxymethylenebutenolidase